MRHDSDPSTQFFLTVKKLTSANTNFTVDLPRATRKISIQCRELVDIKFAMNSDTAIAAGNYQTIRAGVEKFIDDIYLEPETTTIYFQTASSSQPTVEVEYWIGS